MSHVDYYVCDFCKKTRDNTQPVTIEILSIKEKLRIWPVSRTLRISADLCEPCAEKILKKASALLKPIKELVDEVHINKGVGRELLVGIRPLGRTRVPRIPCNGPINGSKVAFGG